MIRRATQFALATVIVSSGWVLAQSIGIRLVTAAAPSSGNEIVLTLDASCPNGTLEVADLDTKFLRGTVAAHSDVGGTGGNDSVTASGTNSTSTVTPNGTVAAPVVSWPAGVPTFAGSALGTHTHTTTATGTNSAPAFTGSPFSGVINHTHTVNVTDPGHTHVEQYNSATTGPNTGWTTVDTSSNTPTAVTTTTASATTGITAASVNPAGGVSSITPAGSVAAPTFTGDSITSSAVSGGTPAGTVAWPAGVPTNTAPTFTGSSSTVGAQTFTGASADNKPAYTKVIFCQRALMPVPQPQMMASGLFVGGLWGFVALRRRPLHTGVSS